MKKLILVTVCIFSFVGSFAQSNKEIKIKTKINCDHCRKCETCGLMLEDMLFKQKGVRKVFIDDKSMTIIVGYNPSKITPEEIRTLITKNGYDADDKKATPESYAALDGCCKK